MCGVILSGGVAKRFGADKALFPVDGVPMIHRVAASMSHAVSEVWISVKQEDRGRQLAEVCNPFATGYLVDSFNFGPLSGLFTAAEKIHADAFLTCSNDVPWIRPATFTKIVERFKQNPYSSMSIVWGNGATEPLIQVVRRDKAKRYVNEFLETRKNLIRSSDILRSSETIYLIYGGNLTQNPYEFSNVNTVSEVTNPKPRGVFKGLVNQDVTVETFEHFRRSVDCVKRRDFKAAGFEHIYESLGFLSKGVVGLAEHAIYDAVRMFENAQDEKMYQLVSMMRETFLSLLERT
uniref:Molybdenum cofactor guanylyltransferase n=1 Tax=Caldiarchaeum subterraneum TaxID=311458 RepID=A0A7C5Y9J0_CALS0